MIINAETNDQLIYVEVEQHDFECAVRTANILKEKDEWLERVGTPEGVNILMHHINRPAYVLIEFNEVEHEMIVNFQ